MAKTLGSIVAKSVNGKVSTSGLAGVVAQTATGQPLTRESALKNIAVIQNASKLSNEQFAGKAAGKTGGKKKK